MSNSNKKSSVSSSTKKKSASSKTKSTAKRTATTKLSALTSKSVSKLSQSGAKNTASVVSSAAKVSQANKRPGKSSIKWRLVVFAVVCAVMLITLPFGSTIENSIRGSVRTDVIGAYSVVSQNELVVHFVDVGQGDCVIVELPDGKTMIIDGGDNRTKYEAKIIEYANENIFKGKANKVFDYMIATHSDSDHIGGLDAVLNEYEVKTIYRPKAFYEVASGAKSPTADDFALEADELIRMSDLRSTGKLDTSNATMITTAVYSKFLRLAYAETWGSGNSADVIFHEAGIVLSGSHNGNAYTITFYAPNSSVYGSGNTAAAKNNLSAVVIVEYNGFSIMLTGDAHSESEAEMIASGLPNVDALKLGHHGSSTSTTSAFLAALDPTYVFICVGEGNSHGHPTEEILERLNDYGISNSNLFRTDLNGDILFGATDSIGIAVSKGEVFVVYVDWWHVVLAVILLAGVVLFLPALITKKK